MVVFFVLLQNCRRIQTICGNKGLNQKDKGDLNPGEPASVLPRHPRNGAGPPGSKKLFLIMTEVKGGGELGWGCKEM